MCYALNYRSLFRRGIEMTSIVGTLNSASWAVVQAARRARHRPRLPALSGDDQHIVAELHAEGGHVTDLAKLAIDGSESMMACSDELIREMEGLPRHSDNKSYTLTSPPDVIIKYPEVLRWGLDERLLAIAEHYIGMPVAYRGVLARIDFPDGQVAETRLWHLDQEDSRILKIIVYLSNVDEEEGPFEYIPANIAIPRRLIVGSKMRVNDERSFEDAVPSANWRTAVGQRGTVVFTDTCRALHRGRPPVRGHRKTLFYCYNCQSPFRPTYCGPLYPVDQFVRHSGPISARQRQAMELRYSA
jgi:hypothetical protein